MPMDSNKLLRLRDITLCLFTTPLAFASQTAVNLNVTFSFDSHWPHKVISLINVFTMWTRSRTSLTSLSHKL